MWEQIRANRRKTLGLVMGMALILAGLGFVIGEAAQPGAGLFGLAVAGIVWVVMTLVAFFQGDRILLTAAGARRIEKQDHPLLFNVVEEMKIASGLDHMPAVYVVDDPSMNAFAIGRKPEKAAVAVTTGLLEQLDRDELQGVIAHEVAHIVNRDVLLMSMVGVMLGTIVLVSEIYLRSMFHGAMYGSSRRYRSSSKKSGGGPMVVIAIVLAILAPLLARLIYLAVSRRREYLADASAAVYTRYPDGLASALEKLGAGTQALQRASRTTAPMYIVNPFNKAKLNAMTSTHPPTAERIAILRGIGGNVSYSAYQQAWNAGGGKRSGHLPKSSVTSGEDQSVRAASPKTTRDARTRIRNTGDLIRNMNQFLFLPCVCGLRIKLPPEYKKDKIRCPKCKRTLTVPVAQIAAMTGIAEHLPEHLGGAAKSKAPDTTRPSGKRPSNKKVLAAKPLTIKRAGNEWMSFKCTCGTTKNLSPSFSASRTECANCGRTILIES